MVMQVPLFGLNGHKVKSTPWTAYVVNPRITCTFEPHQSNQKERDHTWKTCPDTWRKKQKKHKKGEAQNSGTLFQHRTDRWKAEKRPAVSHDLNELLGWKRWSQELRHAVQHIDRQGETEKKANCFTLLRRITKLKTVNSEIRSTVHSPT